MTSEIAGSSKATRNLVRAFHDSLYQSRKSLYFDGTGEYMVSILFFNNTFPLWSSLPFTISMWVKLEDIWDTPEQVFISRWAPHPSGFFNSGGWFINVQRAAGIFRSLTFYFGQYIFNMNWMYSHATFPVNVWVHVAITYDGSETQAGMKMYWNGVEQARTVLGKSPFWSGVTPTTGNSHIVWGARYKESLAPMQLDFWYEGYQDETVLRRYELSAAEVEEEYHGGKPQHPMHVGIPTGKVVDTHFRMGEPGDGAVLAGLGVSWGRYPVGGTSRLGLWNNIAPSRISTDVST